MINYSDNLFSTVHNILVKYPELLSFIRKNQFRIADTDFTYRQINSLDQADLLQDSRESDKKWRYFNLNDLLYLHIVNKTREFNTNNSQLKFLKQTFYSDSINLNKVDEVLYSELTTIALLLDIVPIAILLYSDGDCMLTDNPGIVFTQGDSTFKGRSYILINLYQTFKPFIQKVKSEDFFKNSFNLDQFESYYSSKPLSVKERAILRLVEDRDYSKILISKKENGDLIINAEKCVDGNTITISDVIKLFEKKKFTNLNIQKRNGKNVLFKLEDIFKV